MSKDLQSLVKSMQAKYGVESIGLLGNMKNAEVEAITTGIPSVDYAIGIGGVPLGRIVEIYGNEGSGKTSLTLQIIAQWQKLGHTCAFIDVEHALDPFRAAQIGVDLDSLLFTQPDSAEEALDMVYDLAATGEVRLIVIDSVTALLPKAEEDADMSQNTIGLQARLLSKAMRKLKGILSKNKCTAIFINQIREKVGVMFGCVHGNIPVLFADGRSIPIKKVVEEKIQGEVICYNENTKKFESKRILDWHYNGDVNSNKDYIHIEIEILENRRGTAAITVTPDHLIMTQDGWKQAKDITINDKLLSKYKSMLNGSYKSFLYGVAVGDSYISIRSKNTACIKLQDNNNEEYLKWKINKLSKYLTFKNSSNRYVSSFNHDLAFLKRIVGNRNPLQLFDDGFDALSLAIWYMDDGTLRKDRNIALLSVKRFKNTDTILQISKKLNELGYINSCYQKTGVISFNGEGFKKLMNDICKYVPPCMQYKLPDEYKNKYIDFELDSNEEIKEYYAPIKHIRYASDKQMRTKGKYDITVEDNHNYMVGGLHNGIIVHNSPETTPGGRALRFYSSLRIEVRRGDLLGSKEEPIGHIAKVKIVKNKVASPYKTADFDIYSVGDIAIDPIRSTINLAVDLGVLTKSGSWIYYPNKDNPATINGETCKWQSLQKAVDAIRSNEDVYAAIYKDIMAIAKKDNENFVPENDSEVEGDNENE